MRNFGGKGKPGKKSFGKKPFSKPSGEGRGYYKPKSADEKGDSSDGPKKRFGDKPTGERKSFGDKKPFGAKRSFGPKRSFDKSSDTRRGADSSDRPKRRFDDSTSGERKSFGDKKPFGAKRSFGPKRSFDKSSDRGREGDFKPRRFDDKPGRDTNPFGEKKSYGDRKPFGEKRSFDRSSERTPRRRFDDKDGGERKSFSDRKPRERSDNREGGVKRPYGDRKPFTPNREGGFKKPFDRTDRPKDDFNAAGGERREFKDKPYGNRPGRRKGDLDKKREELGDDWKTFDSDEEASSFINENSDKKGGIRSAVFEDTQQVRLNRYLANTGLCSRREADDLITAGVVKVNGKIVTELGTKVGPGDIVHYGDQPLKRESLTYVLLNKPKDYITTTDDPRDRKTVLHLVEDAGSQRIYPVGRLDRQTTGLLLLTNDGDLAERLTHPRYGIHKIYHVTLDKNFKSDDFATLEKGVELEDGFIKPDEISVVGDGGDKKQIGVVMHSGRNRIVRRMFEHLGYDVVGLDRVTYAGLTKKNLPRGRWRILTNEEVGHLKMLVGGVKKENFKKRSQKRK